MNSYSSRGVCNEDLLPQVVGLVINDSREVTTINTDHKILISILDVNYQKVVWQKPSPRRKWNTKTTDRKIFQKVLGRKLKETAEDRKQSGTNNSPDKIISDVTEAINSALKASTNHTTSTPQKPRMSKEVLNLTEKIKLAEGERSSLLKSHKGSAATFSQPEKDTLEELTSKIRALRIQKDETVFAQMTAENKRAHGIIKSEGMKSKTFWREAKPHEEEAINSLRKSNGSQTTSQEETLTRVRDHFQDLFTPSERPPKPKPPSYAQHWEIKVPN